MERTHKQPDGQQVTAPEAIAVSMEIEDVRLIYGEKGPLFQIHGYVGDYGISIWMSEDEALVAGITVRSR